LENRINQFSLRTVRGQVEGIEVVVAEGRRRIYSYSMIL